MTIEERLVKKYGFTNYPELAGYMMQDGEMINFSYEGYQRDMDHREVSEFFSRSKKQRPGENSLYMYKFMRRGNIRCKCNSGYYGFEYKKLPTENQFRMLKLLNRDACRYGFTFCIEKYTESRKHIVFDFDSFCDHIRPYVDYSVAA